MSLPFCLPQLNRVSDSTGRVDQTVTRFGIGVTDLYYQHPENDRIIPFSREHMALTVRLGERLSGYDAICTIGILQEVPVDVIDVYSILEMTSNTIKPLVVLVSDENAFLSVIELLEDLHGDLASKPFIIPYFNPITPLVINKRVRRLYENVGTGFVPGRTTSST